MADSKSRDLYPPFDGLLHTCLFDASRLASARRAMVASLEENAQQMAKNVLDGNQIDSSSSFLSLVKEIYPLLFSDQDDVRVGALVLLELVVKRDESQQVLFLPEQVEERLNWMRNKTLERKPDGLRAWFISIKGLRTFLHDSKNTKLLNGLLQIPENAMKSSEDGVRKEAFLAWTALIDNFASDFKIISKSTRRNLLLKPFTAPLKTSETCLASRIDAWMHFIQIVASKNVTEADNVASEFLNFCFGGKDVSKDENAKGSLKRPCVIKSFPRFGDRLIQGLTLLLQIADKEKNAVVSSEKLLGQSLVENEALRRQVFHATHKILLMFFYRKSAFDDSVKNLLQAFLNSYADHCCKNQELQMSLDEDIVDFLQQIIQLSEAHCDSSSFLAEVVTVLDYLLTHFSSEILFACKERRKTLAFRLVELLTHKTVVVNVEEEIKNVAQTYSSPVFAALKSVLNKVNHISKVKALTFIDESVNILKDHAPLANVYYAQVWVHLANALMKVIESHVDINCSNSSIECDISASENLLKYPVVVLSNFVDEKETLWKKWQELFKSVSAAVALIPNYENLQLEISVIDDCIKVLSELKRGSKKPNVLISMSKVANTLSLSFPSDDTEKDSCYIELFQILLNRQAWVTRNDLALEYHRNVTAVALNLIINSRSQKTMQLLVKTVYKPLASFLRSSESKLSGSGNDIAKEVESSTINLLEKAVTLLQIHYNGPFDKALLSNVKSFLILVLTHKNANVRRNGQQLWLQSFSNNIEKRAIPSQLADILRRNCCASDSSSLSSMNTHSVLEDDSFEPQAMTSPSVPSSFQGFLQAISPKKKAANSSGNDLQASGTPKSSKKQLKRRLEEEDTQDFVPIASSSKPNLSVLTEHQEEMLGRRRDDIPALYSDLSVDDSVHPKVPLSAVAGQSKEPSTMLSGDQKDESSRRKARTPVKNLMPAAVFRARKKVGHNEGTPSKEKNEEPNEPMDSLEQSYLNDESESMEHESDDMTQLKILTSINTESSMELSQSSVDEDSQLVELSQMDSDSELGAVIKPLKVLLEPLDSRHLQLLQFKSGHVRSTTPLAIFFDEEQSSTNAKNGDDAIRDCQENNEEDKVESANNIEINKEPLQASEHSIVDKREENVIKDIRSANEDSEEASRVEDRMSEMEINSEPNLESHEEKRDAGLEDDEEMAIAPLCKTRERRRRRLTRKAQETLAVGGGLSQGLLLMSSDDSEDQLPKKRRGRRSRSNTSGNSKTVVDEPDQQINSHSKTSKDKEDEEGITEANSTEKDKASDKETCESEGVSNKPPLEPQTDESEEVNLNEPLECITEDVQKSDTKKDDPTSSHSNANDADNAIGTTNMTLNKESSLSNFVGKVSLKQGSAGQKGVKRRLSIDPALTTHDEPNKRSRTESNNPKQDTKLQDKITNVPENQTDLNDGIESSTNDDAQNVNASTKSPDKDQNDVQVALEEDSVMVGDSQDTVDEIASSQETNKSPLQRTLTGSSVPSPAKFIDTDTSSAINPEVGEKESGEKQGSDLVRQHGTKLVNNKDGSPKSKQDKNTIEKSSSSKTSLTGLPQNRAATLLRLSHNKHVTEPSPPSSTPFAETLLQTPTNRPWQRYAPSPSDASPSSSILKVDSGGKSSRKQDLSNNIYSCSEWTRTKRRSSRCVQFSDPPVSERVEVPRLSQLMSISSPQKKSKDSEGALDMASNSSKSTVVQKEEEQQMRTVLGPIVQKEGNCVLETPKKASAADKTVRVSSGVIVQESIETYNKTCTSVANENTAAEAIACSKEGNEESSIILEHKRNETEVTEVSATDGYEDITMGTTSNSKEAHEANDKNLTEPEAARIGHEELFSNGGNSVERGNGLENFANTLNSQVVLQDSITSQVSNGSYLATPPVDICSSQSLAKEKSVNNASTENHNEDENLKELPFEAPKSNCKAQVSDITKEDKVCRSTQTENRDKIPKRIETFKTDEACQTTSRHGDTSNLDFDQIEACIDGLELDQLLKLIGKCTSVLENRLQS